MRGLRRPGWQRGSRWQGERKCPASTKGQTKTAKSSSGPPPLHQRAGAGAAAERGSWPRLPLRADGSQGSQVRKQKISFRGGGKVKRQPQSHQGAANILRG